MLREDISTVMLTLHNILNLGFDLEHFVTGMSEHFRDLMIASLPNTMEIWM